MNSEDERFMRQALELARQAEAKGDVPVGSVVVFKLDGVGSVIDFQIGANGRGEERTGKQDDQGCFAIDSHIEY